MSVVMKPILFNDEMVCATLDNLKTVTRRPVKLEHLRGLEHLSVKIIQRACVAPYQPGDILYVRETWAQQQGLYWHRAGLVVDENGRDEHGTLAPRKWRLSIHMPREAARIFLRVKDVYVEPLFYITGAQAKAEGFSTRNSFLRSFFTIYPDCTMKSFVWVIPYERIEKPNEVAS